MRMESKVEAKNPKTKTRGEKPYSSPRLVDYGDLARLTKGVGGNKGDGGNNSKA